MTNILCVRIELEGYQTVELTVTKKVSGWIWGNILFGGLIGLAVDAASGGLYDLSPEQLNAELKKQDVGATAEDGTLCLLAVLHADPTWKKIGQLTPIE